MYKDWALYTGPGGVVHVVPNDDVHQHFAFECHCRPTTEHKKGCVPLVTHKSFDGREDDENLNRNIANVY